MRCELRFTSKTVSLCKPSWIIKDYVLRLMVFMSRSKNVSLTHFCLYLYLCLQIKFRNISINILPCKYVSGITSLSSQRCGISLPKNRLYIFLFFPRNSFMHVLFYLKHKSNIQSTKGWPIMIDFQKAFLICETCPKNE